LAIISQNKKETTKTTQKVFQSRQITTPTPHHSIFYGLDALPDAQSQSMEGILIQREEKENSDKYNRFKPGGATMRCHF